MANSIAVSTIIAKSALPILENKLAAIGLANREYESVWSTAKRDGYMPGETIQIQKPSRYTWRAGNLAVPQDTVIQTVPATLQMGGTDIAFTTKELTVSTSEQSRIELAIEPAMEAVANEIDRQFLDVMRLYTPNIIGTPGTTPNTQATANAAFGNTNQILDELGAPRSRRNFIMSPSLYNGMTQGQVLAFNPSAEVSRAYREGLLVDAFGYTNAMDQNVPVHTNGTQAVASVTVNGANQTGSSITVSATTGTITRGTKITFVGGTAVNAVNPQSRQSVGRLQSFTVTADVPTGATSIPIYPPIIASGNFQNVTNSPSNGAVVTIFGTASGSYIANVAFQKDSYTLAMVPLFSPPSGKGNISAENTSYKGLNLSIVQVFDWVSRSFFWRFDVLYAIAPLYPETAVIYAT